MNPAPVWDPATVEREPVPWARIEASLRLCQRWEQPHLLVTRIAADSRRAAVAVLLWGGVDGAREVILVQRGFSAPRHGGELAFPGGMVEPGDRDLPATARRELAEELGVTRDLWELGCFPDGVAKAHTRFTPVFLRWEAADPGFELGYEIQAVLRLPLAGLMRAPWTVQLLEVPGGTLPLPRLELPTAPLWGATALVLKRWLDLLSSLENP